MKTIYITESQKNKINDLLLENEGTNMKRARKYLESKGYSPEQRQQILDSIRTDIHNSRLQQCKFLLGVTRLYMEGQLNNGNAIANLNKTLKYIASDAHVNEYDFNLNGENLDTLVQRFAGVAKSDLEQSRNASNARQLTVNNDYTIVPIDSPEEASKYGEYTSWCVTHDEYMYESYTNNKTGRFYFCLRKGFENEPAIEGNGCPLDNYGLSMIAVSVTMEGEVNTITCRWNHDNGGNDNIMTIEQLEDVIGRNFYQTFKPYTREELHAKGVILFDEVQDLLDSGKKPEKMFDWYGDFSEGFARVELNDKFNFINVESKLLSSQWFDGCGDFSEGFGRVELNGKYNFINREGKIVFSQWFDWCGYFSEGFAKVHLNDKINFINKNGKILSNQGFDYCENFRDGFAKVGLNCKENFINREGKLLSSQWFKRCADFSEGFARVELNDKYNFINEEGKLLNNQWFDGCGRFSEGFAWVRLNDNFFNIDRDGRLYDEHGSPVSESKKNRKTIYITESQRKKLKKAITAQDQVGGKVNAGVMDSVVGMCENIEDDKYELGAEKGDISPYYHVNESNEETITLYHGVNRKGLEYNLEQGCFVPRVCSEGGPKAIWLSEKQYNYEFTFAFDFPKSSVEQLSNVDYIFTNKIGFNDFNCRLVRTSISSYFDNIVVETNILNDKLSKLHFRYFPDLGIELWKEFKQYPNILERFINPYIEKYQQLSESINISKENRMIDINQVINSPEFKAWFGDSKVVDEKGIPIIVHHGSPKFEGDKFNKGKIGKSINQGEEGVFCTTQDMSWAKRFSYPATEGSSMFTVKIDDTKPGDILSGFLKLEHPLDFFNLSDNDIQNMFKMNIKYDEFGKAWVKKIGEKEYYKKFYKEVKQLLNIGNHNLIKFYIHRNLGEALKEFGYDGYIALMEKNGSAIEYCFIEPNQFKSIYSLTFNPNSDSIYENKKKTIKNDKGEIVPEKCDKCGGEVVLQIHGEPVYLCKNCGKYFGTMPFHLKENIELEDKWNGEGEKLEPLKRIKNIPPILYHASYKKNRESILKNGIFASVGDEYSDWWNYEGPNGEIPDDDELEYLVFLTTKPTTWSDNYFLDQMDIFEIDTKQLDNTCFYLDPDKHMALKGSICYTGDIPPSAIKLYNSVYRGKSVNENVELEIKPDEVDLSSFNIKKKLNPKFWIDGHLDSRIRLKLLDISDDFIEYLGIDPDIVKDVIMTGSLANFNWNEEFSDIDLHVLLDYSDVDENTEFVKQYFMSQKNSWNNEHQDLKIFGFPIEVYVQDISEKHDSSGVYSLDRDKWLREPDRDVLATSKVNKEFIKNKVSDYVNKIDKLLYIYKKVKNDEYKLRKLSEKIEKLWDEIKNSRKIGFEKSGGKEINNNNIVFKSLRRQKYLDKLYDLKTKTYDKLNSL